MLGGRVFEPGAIVLFVLIASFALFLTDALRYDLVALLCVLVLVISGTLTAEEGFAGFSSEAAIVIACMCVFGHALTKWGVGESLSQRLLGSRTDHSEMALILRLSLVAGALAAFMTDVAVVGILIPLAASIARRQQIPIARLLIPISFGCFLGDLLLVIGSAKNIALNGVLLQKGVEPFGVFEIAPFGLVVLALGALYMAGPGRALLPRGRVDESLARYQLPKFVSELEVEPSSTLINRGIAELTWFEENGISVLGLVRAGGDGSVLAPGPYNRVRRGDTLLLQGEPDALVRARERAGLVLRDGGVGAERLSSADVKLVEAIVPGGSSLVGRTLAEAEFRARTGLNVLAISKANDVEVQKIARTPLSIGDTLLIQGHLRDLERAKRERDVLVLGEIEVKALGRGAWISVSLLVFVLAVATLKLAPLSVAALSGALGLVLLRCVTPKELYTSVDWMVVILIGGMLALGKAFDKHELGALLAKQVTSLGGFAREPHVLLAILCVTAVVLAQATTAVGTSVILAPVALSLAGELGLSYKPFAMAVLAGCNCSFLSPVSHPALAMVVVPGNYRFRDFLRAGTPLTILVVVVATFLLPVIWPFEP